MQPHPWFAPRPELDELVNMLDSPPDRAIQVVGADGAGKTTLLNLCRERLAETGRLAIFVSCRGLISAEDLGEVVVEMTAAAASRWIQCTHGLEVVRRALFLCAKSFTSSVRQPARWEDLCSSLTP